MINENLLQKLSQEIIEREIKENTISDIDLALNGIIELLHNILRRSHELGLQFSQTMSARLTHELLQCLFLLPAGFSFILVQFIPF
jgi:hypothetical protein